VYSCGRRRLAWTRIRNGRNLSRLPASVGVESVALRSQPMPRAAVDAALDTFALVTRERHPGVVALPLRDVGADRAVIAPAAGQVIRPFAAPEDRDALGDWGVGIGALDEYRVDRAAEDSLAVGDR
jgi:hypothetical protein